MRLITLNGVKLLVYRNGMILRFYEKGRYHYHKGWNCCLEAISTNGYRTISLQKQRYYVHRIMGYAYLELDITDTNRLIDHIDRKRDNNRLDNLRIVSPQQNHFNLTATKGYSWNKRDKKWTAQIHLNKKKINLGYFDTKEEAHQAYLDAKANYHITQSS